MNLIPIFALADILHTPQGIALCGTNHSSPQLLTQISKIDRPIEEITSISFRDRHHRLVSLPVLKVQYTTSISGGVNLFLLLGQVELPSDLTLGTIIYYTVLQSDSTPDLRTAIG